ARRPRPRASAPPPVTPPPPHDPGDLHLPAGLLAVLGAEELKQLPALRSAPLAGIHIDEPFLSHQLRTVPPPVTRTARPLPPLPAAARPDPAIAPPSLRPPGRPPPPPPPPPPRPFLREGEPPFSDDEPAPAVPPRGRA